VRWKIFFVSMMAMICLFFSTSTSNAANWYYIGTDKYFHTYIDSSNVHYQKDSNGNENYDLIQYWEKLIYLDEEGYAIKRFVLSLSDRRIYWYDYAVYNNDGTLIFGGNTNGASGHEILPGSLEEKTMQTVLRLVH